MAACAGTLVYVIVSLLGGKDGLFATRQLEAQKQLIVKHTADVQAINDELALENEILYRDSVAIMAEARKLDLIQDGEKLVKINGLNTTASPVYNTGSVMQRQDIFYLPEWVCKLLGVLVFVLVLLILVLKDFAQYPVISRATARAKKESAAKPSGVYAPTATTAGEPIYDMRKV